MRRILFAGCLTAATAREVREKISNAAGRVGQVAGRDSSREARLDRLNTDYAPQSTRSGSESAVRRAAAAI